jgi:chromosomal replication initiation ATPase DnaA
VFGTTLEALATRGQHNHAARDAAVLLTRELLSESLDKIAARFGEVSRSSISEIAKRARECKKTDATFRQQLEASREKWE